MRITQEHIEQLYAADVVDQDGDKVGGVAQVYLDDRTGEPAWVTVKAGFFGGNETFIPLQTADYDDGRIRVPYEKSFIKDAPNIEADRDLSESEYDELYRYYSVQTEGYGAAGAGTGAGYGAAGTGAGYGAAGTGDVDRGTTTGTTGRGDVTDEDRMTLHEERVDVGTERVQTGRVRLRKNVVTDQETVTVPVQREEYEVVREPVSGDTTTGRADLGEDEIEVAVHEERPVIEKDVVATEEVGVDRRTVSEDRDVVTDVAHEEVDVVEDTRRGDDTTGRGPRT